MSYEQLSNGNRPGNLQYKNRSSSTQPAGWPALEMPITVSGSLIFPGRNRTEEWWEAVKSSIGQAMRRRELPALRLWASAFPGRCTAWWRWMKTKSRFARPLSIWTREAARTLPKSVPWQKSDAGRTFKPAQRRLIISTIYWMKSISGRYTTASAMSCLPGLYQFSPLREIGTEYTDAGATLAFSVKNYRWCTETV